MYLDLTKGSDVQRLDCGWVLQTAQSIPDMAKAHGILSIVNKETNDSMGMFIFSLKAGRDTPDITPDHVANQIAMYYHKLIGDFPEMQKGRVAALQFYPVLPTLLSDLGGMLYKWDK